jgi:hypothetical protein
MCESGTVGSNSAQDMNICPLFIYIVVWSLAMVNALYVFINLKISKLDFFTGSLDNNLLFHCNFLRFHWYVDEFMSEQI